VPRTTTRILLLLAITGLLINPHPAKSQAAAQAFLYQPDPSRFPQVSVFLALADPLGGRPAGLTAEQLRLREDDADAADPSLAEEETGFRLLVVVDPGADLTYLLPEGDSRLARLRTTLAAWLGDLPMSGMDDLTLITPGGTLSAHTADVPQFLAALDGWTPTASGSSSLSQLMPAVLDAAVDPMPRAGMRSIILAFSAAESGVSGELKSQVCPRALELHTPVYGVWSGRVQPATRADYDSFAAFSAACGGYAVALENPTGLRTLLRSLATQRTQYLLEYRSRAAEYGEHTLQAEIVRPDFPIVTQPMVFSVDVQPPQVTWKMFPGAMARRSTDPLAAVEDYLPQAAEFEVEVAFPDGHPRRIASQQLLADGIPVWECLSDSCGGIRWDLSSLSEPGTRVLQVVVRDELGLESRTEPRDLVIDVIRPSGWDSFRARYLVPVSIILAVLLAGGLLAAAVTVLNRSNIPPVRTGPITPDMVFPAGGKRTFRREKLKSEGRTAPPAAQAEQETDFIYILLDPLDPEQAGIRVAAREVVLGSDAAGVDVIVADPSVALRHARIVHMPDGSAWVFDLGSTAGTWLNYEEIPREGRALREGDRLNLGRAAFRIRLAGDETERNEA
jgi:hypothetical protein